MTEEIPCIKVDWIKFSPKQRAAIAGYMKHGNKIKAYRDAYDTETPNLNTVRKCAYNLFKKPHVKAMIEQIQTYAIQKANIQMENMVDGCMDEVIEAQKEFNSLAVDAHWVLRRLALLADFNIKTFIRVDSDGNAVYDFSEASDDDWYCIQEYVAEELQRGQGEDKYFVDKLKIKGYDKLRALELVGKHVDIQAFKDQSDVNLNATVTHRTLEDFYSDAVKPTTKIAETDDAGDDN
jgi:phage terminase small subunit